MESNTKPSKEDINDLLKSMDGDFAMPSVVEKPSAKVNNEDLAVGFDADAADVLNSFKKLQKKVPGLRSNDPLLSNVLSFSDDESEKDSIPTNKNLDDLDQSAPDFSPLPTSTEPDFASIAPEDTPLQDDEDYNSSKDMGNYDSPQDNLSFSPDLELPPLETQDDLSSSEDMGSYDSPQDDLSLSPDLELPPLETQDDLSSSEDMSSYDSSQDDLSLSDIKEDESTPTDNYSNDPILGDMPSFSPLEEENTTFEEIQPTNDVENSDSTVNSNFSTLDLEDNDLQAYDDTKFDNEDSAGFSPIQEEEDSKFNAGFEDSGMNFDPLEPLMQDTDTQSQKPEKFNLDSENTGLSNTSSHFDDLQDSYGGGLDLNLEDIGDSFYSPASFEQEPDKSNDSHSSDSFSFSADDMQDLAQMRENTTRDVQTLRDNLANIPANLSLKIKNFLNSRPAHDIKAKELREELEKPDINIKRIQEIIKPSSPPSSRSRIFIAALGLLLLIFLGPRLWHWIAESPEDQILQVGLDLINDSKIYEGNTIFLNNHPNLGWYNKYTSALINKGAYDLALGKLIGDSSGQKGALELSPQNKTALTNLATLLIKEEKYDLALSSDAKINGRNAVSLNYLQKTYPKDRNILDLVGQAYIGSATQHSDTKSDILSKAHQLYAKLRKETPKDSLVLSRLLEISLIENNPRAVLQQVNFLTKYGLLSKLTMDTLAKLGLHSLNDGDRAQATVFFNALKSKKTYDPKTEFTPLAFYFMGNFHLLSGSMNNAENNLILALYGNNLRDSNGNTINTISPSLQSKIDNSLGRIYMNLLQQYNSKTPLNEQRAENYKNLATYHLLEATHYAPTEPTGYALLGDLAYKQQNYPQAIADYSTSIRFFREEREKVPSSLTYNYGNSLYQMGQYQMAANSLIEIRSQNPLVYPSVEYLLGMAYLKQANYPQAVDRFDRAREYFQRDIQALQKRGYATTMEDNKKLYFNAVLANNLGVIYQREGARLNSDSMKAQARIYFYEALEYSKRMNPKTTLTFPSLNLQSSLFEKNINIMNAPTLNGDSPMIYDYSPTSLLEYQ